MAFRRKDDLRAEKFMLLKEHAQVTATTTIKLYKVPAGRSLRLTAAQYVNVTGLANDGTNAFAGTIQNGSNVAALLFNTDSGDADVKAIAADTIVAADLSATDAFRTFAAGETVTLVLTEDGTATLPAGTVVLEGLLF